VRIFVNAIKVKSEGGAFNILCSLIDGFTAKDIEFSVGASKAVLDKLYTSERCNEFPLQGILKGMIYSYYARIWRRYRIFSLNSLSLPLLKNQYVYYHFPLTIFGIEVIDFKEYRLFLTYLYHLVLEYCCFPLSSGVIYVQSDFMREQIRRRWRFKNWEVVIDRPSLPGVYYKQKVHTENESLKRLIFPASSFRYKNHDWIINSFEEAQIEIELYSNLSDQEFNSRYQKSKHVHHTYFHAKTAQEMVGFYMRSDVLVFPSKAETLGLPLLEAMTLGLPIIAVDFKHIRSVLQGYPKVYWVSHDINEAKYELQEIWRNLEKKPY
jgi:glycosyltransferase involved in cell wall biosynthesis